MSSSSLYVGQVSAPLWQDWAARSGVPVTRLASAAGGGTLSAPEMRDLILAATGLGYKFSGATQASAVTENAGVSHPTAKVVRYDLKSDALY